MSRLQKHEDITLMHSKCEDSMVEGQSSIFRAVVKSLKGERCEKHQQKFSYYYKNKLLCSQCFGDEIGGRGGGFYGERKRKYQYYYHLQNILNHPIILTIDESQLMAYPLELMELCLSSYKPLYKKKSDFRVQKVLIDSFVSRVKNKIEQLCDKIVSSCDRMEENMQKHGEMRDNMKNLNNMYEDQMMEMLGERFTEGTKSQLENIFGEYSKNNENPFATIQNSIEQLMNLIETTPFIDTHKLEQIYTKVTDEQLWKTDEIIQTLPNFQSKKCETAEMMINEETIHLQNQYKLVLQENSISLESNEQILGNLSVHIDSLYQLPQYKLLGVNYDKLMVINYFDQLKIQNEIDIPGCTDVLPFPYHIIAISNNNLIKISLETKEYEVLGKKYKNLKYSDRKSMNFTCENSKGQLVMWNGYTQFLTPVVS